MTEAGKALIRKFEGCSLVAYLCPSKVWTIGYGNTFYADGTPVKEGDKIDMYTANQLFDITLDKFEKQVKMLLGDTLLVTLPKEAIDALVSLAYNIGTGAFAKSTLLKKLKENKLNFNEIEKWWTCWNKSNGKVLNGLVRRRATEFDMYMNAVLNQYTKKETYDIGYNNGKKAR